MTGPEFARLAPLIVLVAAPVVLLLLIAVVRRHPATFAITLVSLVVAFVCLPLAATAGVQQVTPLFRIDQYALIYLGLIFATGFVVAILSYRYLEEKASEPEEFYILLLIATLGAAVLVCSSHFASFFLGLEILSVSLYALIAYPRTGFGNIEAGIKYLVLAAASAAFLLFGMALVYAELGTMEFARIASFRPQLSSAEGLVVVAGLGMIVVGIGFKLAVVPFHLWTPDVYEGAPAPVSGFVATVSKGAMFALLLRLFTEAGFHADSSLFWVFSIIAFASMAAGNLLALLQSNVKRILAYSSIAHLGYLLVAFLASGALVVTAVTFYLVSYFVATMTAFGVITVLSQGERDTDEIAEYRGLFRRHPWLAGTFTASLLSLAGIPLTAGFIGKFYLIAAGAESSLWVLVLTLIVTSVIGLFYYLRVVVALFSEGPVTTEVLSSPSPVAAGESLILAGLVAVMVWLGIYPAPLIDLIQRMAQRLT